MTLAERFAKDGGAVGAETEAFFVRALKGTGEERAALSALFDAALRTPTGRGMLEGAVGAGYSFAFEEGLDANSQSGACDSALKAIVLNPKCSFGAQLSTLVHEACHALQAERGPKYPSLFCVADQMKYHRAIEADACAHECAFICEAKAFCPEVREDALKRGMPMLETYERVAEGTGDFRAAMNAAFKSWYDYPPYQKAYDRWHKEDVRTIAEHGLKKDYNGYFMTQISSEKVAALCLYREKPYVEPEFLETPQAFSVPDADKEEILEITRRYALLVGRLSCDRSVERMFSREDPTGENKRVAEHKAREVAFVKSSKETAAPPAVPVQDRRDPKKSIDFWKKIRGKITRFGGR